MMSSMPGNRVFLGTRPGKLGLARAYIHGFEVDAGWSHQPQDI
jgi:hypothetical protein